MGHYDEFYEEEERRLFESREREYAPISLLSTYEKVLLLREAWNGWKRERILQEVLEEIALKLDKG